MKSKRIIILLPALVFMANMLNAQVDRSNPPEPKPAPEIKIKQPQTFTLDNGLEVIVAQNKEVPMVYFQLAVDVDPVKEEDAVGYVEATGNLLRNGTENRSKSEIDEEIDYIGANLSTFSNGFYATCLSEHKGDLMELLSDILLNPTFPEEELGKYQEKEISELSSQKTDASSIANRVGKKLRYKDHPYGEIKTEETIGNITRDLIEEYHENYYKPNASYLVISGDIEPEEAKNLADQYFGGWEQGDAPKHEYSFPEVSEEREIAFVNKNDAVQSVVGITYPVDLKPGSEDAIKARVTNSILGGSGFSAYLMKNLREDKGYTYGAYSSLQNDPLVGSFMARAEVNGEATDSAVTEFLYEMDRIRDERVDEDHLDLVKNSIYGQFARDMEDPRNYSRYTLNLMRYNLPDDYYQTYLQKVEKVTIDEIQQTADKYIKPDEATILVVGNEEEVADKLAKFASDEEVDYYDIYGNPREEAETEIGNTTANDVIEKYIEAIGGREKLEKVEDVKQVFIINMQGRELESRIYQKKPNYYLMEMKMNGNVMQRQIFDGEEGRVEGMGQKQTLEGEQLERFKYEAQLHKFLKYNELDVNMELTGVEKIDGNDAYKVNVEHDNGHKHVDFFDVESGLKVQSQSKVTTQQGEVTQVESYKDYKEVNGVLMPHTQEISGMQSMTMKAKEIEINTGLSKDFFK
ncbi:MAG: pitrilysin family protein [Bacteroidales bacterium]